MNFESIETKNLTVEDVINESRKEESKLNNEIENKLPDEIWGYDIETSYEWYLKPSEKWFAIILSRGEYGLDDPKYAIIVKYKKWEIVIEDTADDVSSNEFQLNPDEISEDENINKINKIIWNLGFTPLTNKNWDINKLWAAIDSLKK